MKIGDKFTENGKTYEVIGENASGLISTLITSETPVKEEAEVSEAPKRRTRKSAE